MRMVLEQFKCFALRQNKLTSLVTCSTTKADSQSTGMWDVEERLQCKQYKVK